MSAHFKSFPTGCERRAGYLLVQDERQPLPVGSTLKGGSFYWQAGLGFLGNYDLLFERRGNEPVRVQVKIRPKTYSKPELH